MDENELDAMIMAVEKKIDDANRSVDSSFSERFELFHKGQFQAYCEILSMLNNQKKLKA